MENSERIGPDGCEYETPAAARQALIPGEWDEVDPQSYMMGGAPDDGGAPHFEHLILLTWGTRYGHGPMITVGRYLEAGAVEMDDEQPSPAGWYEWPAMGDDVALINWTTGRAVVGWRYAPLASLHQDTAKQSSQWARMPK